jgi:hypothetical protein
MFCCSSPFSLRECKKKTQLGHVGEIFGMSFGMCADLEQLVSKELSERVGIRKAPRRTIPREVAAMATATDCQRFGSGRRPQQSELRYGHSAGEAHAEWIQVTRDIKGLKLLDFVRVVDVVAGKDGFVQKIGPPKIQYLQW